MANLIDGLTTLIPESKEEGTSLLQEDNDYSKITEFIAEGINKSKIVNSLQESLLGDSFRVSLIPNTSISEESSKEKVPEVQNIVFPEKNTVKETPIVQNIILPEKNTVEKAPEVQANVILPKDFLEENVERTQAPTQLEVTSSVNIPEIKIPSAITNTVNIPEIEIPSTDVNTVNIPEVEVPPEIVNTVDIPEIEVPPAIVNVSVSPEELGINRGEAVEVEKNAFTENLSTKRPETTSEIVTRDILVEELSKWDKDVKFQSQNMISSVSEEAKLNILEEIRKDNTSILKVVRESSGKIEKLLGSILEERGNKKEDKFNITPSNTTNIQILSSEGRKNTITAYNPPIS